MVVCSFEGDVGEARAGHYGGDWPYRFHRAKTAAHLLLDDCLG